MEPLETQSKFATASRSPTAPRASLLEEAHLSAGAERSLSRIIELLVSDEPEGEKERVSKRQSCEKNAGRRRRQRRRAENEREF